MCALIKVIGLVEVVEANGFGTAIAESYLCESFRLGCMFVMQGRVRGVWEIVAFPLNNGGTNEFSWLVWKLLILMVCCVANSTENFEDDGIRIKRPPRRPGLP